MMGITFTPRLRDLQRMPVINLQRRPRMASIRRPMDDEDEQDEFNRRADAVDQALDGAHVHEEMVILTMFLARWLSRIEPESREIAHKDMFATLENDIREWIIAGSDS